MSLRLRVAISGRCRILRRKRRLRARRGMRNRKVWLMAFCAVAGIGCSDGGGSQVLTGRITTSGALAVRAVTADSTVTAAQVRSDGSFSLALPAGKRYRLEVLTTSGVRHMYSQKTSGLTALSFKVCEPVDPWDIGTVGNGTDPSSGGGGGDTPCDPADPNCTPPDMCTDPADPSCGPPKCMDPTDPNCMPPPPCDPTDPNCLPPPPPCADPSDPYCKCDASGNCPPPSCDPGDPMCPPPPPPPCADPTDPGTCQDPCMADPASCGCAMEDPNCWPPPKPPECDAAGMCDPGTGGMTPTYPPGDFGCQEISPS